MIINTKKNPVKELARPDYVYTLSYQIGYEEKTEAFWNHKRLLKALGNVARKGGEISNVKIGRIEVK